MPKPNQNRSQLIQKRKREQEAKNQEHNKERQIIKNRKILGETLKEELETKNQERKLELAKRKELEAILPSFEIKRHDDFADERIIEAIPAAWKRIIDSRELTSDKLEDLKRARRLGFGSCNYGPFPWATWLGSFLLRELAKDFELATLRRIDVAVNPTSRNQSHVLLDIRSLESVKPFVACSPKKPTIKLPAGEFVVAYNLRKGDHFISQFEERAVNDPNDYDDKGKIFSNLYRRTYFDPIQLPDKQWAARLWDFCNVLQPIGALWNELLGDSVSVTTTDEGMQFFVGKEGLAYYLMGYCPINETQLSSGYAIFNTFLHPGMDNTPKAAVLMRGLNTYEKSEFQKRAEQQTMRNLNHGKDFSTIRAYHQLVPQVRLLNNDVFCDY